MQINPSTRDTKWEQTIAKGSLVMYGPFLYRVESVEKIGYGRYVTLRGMKHDVVLSQRICVVKLREPRRA